MTLPEYGQRLEALTERLKDLSKTWGDSCSVDRMNRISTIMRIVDQAGIPRALIDVVNLEITEKF